MSDRSVRGPERGARAEAGVSIDGAGTGQGGAVALRQLLASRAGERQVVVIQDYPDPDAISSALAYRMIAAGFGIEADILYQGMISHPENLALVNLLSIDLVAFTDETSLSVYDAAVFIDNQGTTTRLTRPLLEAGVPTLAVIDHHDPQDVLDPIFSDVRPVGAAATLLSEYLESNEFFTLQRTNVEHVQLATALLHGLHSETQSFIHAGSEEFHSASFLTRYADADLLERVLCVQKSRGTMNAIEAALGGRTIRGGLSIAGVGHLRWSDRDAIPQAAEFLLKEENVHTVVVFGFVQSAAGHESIIGSLRTTSATLSVDAFLKRALGRDVAGRYHGGGRSRAGGFEIDLGFLTGAGPDPEDWASRWALFEGQVRRKLLSAAGLERAGEGGRRTEAEGQRD